MFSLFLVKLLLLPILLSSPVHTPATFDSLSTNTQNLTPVQKVKYFSKQCWALREKNTDSSLIYGKAAIHLADSLNLLNEYGKANGYVGVVLLHYEYKTKDALPYLRNSLDVALQLKDSTGIGYAYNNLGDVYYLTGNTPLALDYAKRSMDYFTAIKDSSGIAYSHINYGLAYRLEKKYHKSLDHFLKAIEIRKKLGDKLGYASGLLEIAIVYNKMGNYNKALNYYQQSLLKNKQINNKRWSAFSLDGIGHIFYKEGKYAEALNKFNESLTLNKERNHIYGIISNKIGKALVYSKTGKKSLGEKELTSTLSLARELEVPTKLMETYKAFVDFYLNLKDYNDAQKSINNFLTAYDSLYSRQQFETLSELQHSFAISQKLSESQKILEIKESEQKYLIVIIFLLAFSIAVIFWKYYTNKKLNRELQALNYSKEKLFSIISHDLRNPFFALMGYLELLKENDLTEEEKIKFIHNLDSTTKNTYDLLENLLHLSASRIGNIEFSPSECNLRKLTEKLVRNLTTQFQQKSIKLETKIESEKIYADEKMLEIILRNLISNAIKYSNENGTITITSQEKENKYFISVSDTGTGINEKIRAKLFESEFLQSQKGTAGEKGTGLGLSLCKEFVDRHNGKITVESIEGKGSTFTFYIPRNTSY